MAGVTKKAPPPRPDPAAISDANRRFVIDWLRDRSAFHTWFASIVSGSFVLITVFGSKPGFAAPEGQMLAIAFALLVFSLIANLVSVWSIPSWIYRVNTEQIGNSRRLRLELAINAWVGVISFVAGVTLAFIGHMAG